MAIGFLNKLFGTNMAKEVKRLEPTVRKIEALEEEYRGYTDAQLQAKTPELKQRYANGESLDDLLPEAFATCREAADRVLGLRPYRVQLIGGEADPAKSGPTSSAGAFCRSSARWSISRAIA